MNNFEINSDRFADVFQDLQQRNTRAGRNIERPAGHARRTGTTISFRLSTPARVALRVERRTLGRRRNGRCEAPSRRNRGRPRCRRWALVRGSFSRAGLAGRNRVGFNGWIGGRALAPGSYRLVVTPRGGSASRAAFRIVR